ncbi:hypothetical protein KL921_000996 [Ogataea angusta]|nr:hypothetical protein KL921_000996 [Ogataea angusta]
MEDPPHKRKRSVSDDEGYEPSFSGASELPGKSLPEVPSGGYQQSESWAKRPRRALLPREVELAKNICAEIGKIGEFPQQLSLDLENVSNSIAQEIDTDDFLRNSLLEFLVALTVEQPQKVFIVGALVQLTNFKNPKAGQYVLEYLHSQIQDLFEQIKVANDDVLESSECGVITRLKLLLRLVAVLSPMMVSADPITKTYEQLLELAVELQENSAQRVAVAQLLYFNVLVSVPYHFAVQKDEGFWDRVLEIARKFKLVDISEEIQANYRHFKPSNRPYEAKELVKLTLPALEAVDKELPFFVDLQQIVKSHEPEDVERHQFQHFNIPSGEHWASYNLRGNIDSLWKDPRYVLECFLPSVTGFDTVPPVESYLSIILRDVTQDIVQNMEFNRVTVSRQLLSLNAFFNEKLFSKPNSSIDKLTILNNLNSGVDLISSLENNEELDPQIKESMIQSATYVQQEFDQGYTSTWKMEQVVTEAILDLMFHLSDAPSPTVYYQMLLADTCGRDWANVRRAPDSEDKVTFAKVLGTAFRYFYSNFKYLDFELRERFILWMTAQLSNFGFDWQWAEWIDDLNTLDKLFYHPTIYLFRNIIGREIRLSTPQTVKATLPPEFHRFLRLSLWDKRQVVTFDSKLFGSKLAESAYEANYAAEENIEAITEDAGNADIYHIVDQYLFNNEDHPYHELCHSIYTNIQEGESLQQFNDLIVLLKEQIAKESAEHPGAEEYLIGNIDCYIVTLVIQSTCIIGSRSLSVVESGALELCGAKLRKVLGLPAAEGEHEDLENDQFPLLKAEEVAERQKWLIDGVLRLWNNEPRIGYLILERIKNKGFISTTQLVDSFFANNESLTMISQVYASELFDRMVASSGSEAESKDLLQTFYNKIIEHIDLLIEKLGDDREEMILGTVETEESADQDTELRWGLHGCFEIMRSKARKFASLTNFEQLGEKIEGGVRSEVARKYVAAIVDGIRTSAN